MARAKHLAAFSGGKVRIARGTRKVTYVHLMFEAHQIVIGNGVASESFFPGPVGLRSMLPPQQAELFSLFPDLGHRPVEAVIGPTARRFLRRKDLPGHISGISPMV